MEFRQHNRKYLGSKAALLDFICRTIEEVTGDPGDCTFLDPFAGTGVVAAAFAEKAREVVVSDILYANYVANKAFLCTTEENADLDKVGKLLDQLNRLEGEEGYAVEHYGGTYFTLENARRIQAVREQIAAWQREKLITEQEFYILLTSLLYAADKVANTCGQYDSYLKNLGQPPFSPSGVHLVDGYVYSRLRLYPLAISAKGNCRVFCRDANQLVAETPADILYLDPPYNTRQYCDNYHVLENIARWQKPPTSGKTRKFDRNGLRSRYSQKRHAPQALRELVESARCRYLFLSYNSEGIISDEEILAVLRKKGEVVVREEPYPVFGRGAGRARARKLTERLFCCIVG